MKEGKGATDISEKGLKYVSADRNNWPHVSTKPNPESRLLATCADEESRYLWPFDWQECGVGKNMMHTRCLVTFQTFQPFCPELIKKTAHERHFTWLFWFFSCLLLYIYLKVWILSLSSALQYSLKMKLKLFKELLVSCHTNGLHLPWSEK